LERETELGRVSDLLAGLRDGYGRLLLVEGSPGVGKTRLLRAVRGLGQETGARLLSACASELEREFAFGVVRQLLEAPLRALERDDPALTEGAAALSAPALRPDTPVAEVPGGSPTALLPLLHGLYWLCANLADRGPLVMTVDDAHWADSPSLRFLLYLAGRIEELPILVVLAARPGQLDAEVLSRLCALPATEVVPLRALSEAATAGLVRSRLGRDADGSFCRGCHAVTLGNPFLVGELMRAVREQGLPPTAEGAVRLGELVPHGVHRAVILRLGRLGDAATSVARAVATLGDGCPLHQAAELASLDAAEAIRACDELTADEVLAAGRPLRFVHPIVRSAVYTDMPEGERHTWHAQAARLLARDAAPSDRVAVHLVQCEGAREPWVVGVLRAAAADACAKGAPETATGLLTRALAEPPGPGLLPRVLWELGCAEKRTDPAASAGHLSQAFELSIPPAERGLIGLELMEALLITGRAGEAVDVVRSSIAALDGSDPELALRLEAELIGGLRQGMATFPLADERLRSWYGRVTGSTPAERLILSHLAVHAGLTGGDADRVAQLAEGALGNGKLLEDRTSDSLLFYLPLYALMCADRFDVVRRHLDDAMSDARRRGSVPAFATASLFRSFLSHVRGALADAEADARHALDAAQRLPGWTFGLPAMVSGLVQALVDRGDIDSAQAALAAADLEGTLPDTVPFRLLLMTRGRLRLAQGRAGEALHDLLELMEREETRGPGNLFLHPYRLVAAEALGVAGRADEALRLADAEVARARAWGAPRFLGMALRSAGLAHGGDAGLALLTEAAQVLGHSPARLARAEALVDLGSALRRHGRRREALEPLRQGLDLAHRCGARVTEEKARAELLVLGARPRRPVISGREALTAGELRVAEMAAGALSNREIAQSLFVTVGTVELHLTHAYQKLGIRSRDELPGALAAG
ncbi:MAG: ATP-binding protein, partial [Actinomycetota bacterium]